MSQLISLAQPEAIELLRDFVESCAFIHDDWNPELGYADWDQYDTNPLLLGAKTCIVTSLDGFGDHYLNYLNELGIVPEVLIKPQFHSYRLIDNILGDDSALAALRREVAYRRLDISVFYSDQINQLENLAGYTSSASFRPAIYPPPPIFALLNNRLEAWEILKQNQIPLPIGEICTSMQELTSFYGYVADIGFRNIILKRGHRNSTRVGNHMDLELLADRIGFPVLAEVVYPTAVSPVCQLIAWRGQFLHLFTLKQNIENWHFVGDQFPNQLSGSLQQRAAAILSKLINLFPTYAGVIGVDFIVTTHNELFVVDVNPRFNSSTYPFFFLAERLQKVAKKSVYANYRIIDDCPVLNLSCILRRGFRRFEPRSNSGVLLFNPVIDFAKTGLVRRWSYLAVGQSLEERITLEREIENCVRTWPTNMRIHEL